MTLISLTGCATDRQAIADAEDAKAQRDAVGQAVEIASQRAPLPSLPADCKNTEKAGVGDSDGVDVALKKYDNALGRQNSRTIRCARWFDNLRTNWNLHGSGR